MQPGGIWPISECDGITWLHRKDGRVGHFTQKEDGQLFTGLPPFSLTSLKTQCVERGGVEGVENGDICAQLILSLG